MRLILFSLLVVFICACSAPAPLIKRYKPSMLSIGLTYMPKPTSFDSSRTANYISGGFMQGIQTSEGGSNVTDDLINLGQLSFSRGHRYKNINYAYGADVFAGHFINNSVPKETAGYFSNKSVFGYELKTSINMMKAYKNFDFRILGLDLAYSKEYGDYSKFRNQLQPETENFYSITENSLFSAALNTEIIFKGNRHSFNQFGFRLSLINTFGVHYYKDLSTLQPAGGSQSGITGSGSVFIKHKNYFLIGEAGEGGRINLGYIF